MEISPPMTAENLWNFDQFHGHKERRALLSVLRDPSYPRISRTWEALRSIIGNRLISNAKIKEMQLIFESFFGSNLSQLFVAKEIKKRKKKKK